MDLFLTRLATGPVDVDLGLQLVEAHVELALVEENLLPEDLLAQVKAGDLEAVARAKEHAVPRLQELALSKPVIDGLRRFATTGQVRVLVSAVLAKPVTRSVKELVAQYIKEAKIFEKLKMQIDHSELALLQEKGWDAVWDQMSPEHFIEVWVNVMGNFILDMETLEAEDRRAIGELLTLGLQARSHHYPVVNPNRFEELIGKAMRVVRGQETMIGIRRPGNFDIPLLVDSYFELGTKAREWFVVAWWNAELRSEGANAWERLSAVVRDRLRTAAELVAFRTYFVEHGRGDIAEGQIRRAHPNVTALLGLIEALNAKSLLNLTSEEQQMVRDLHRLFD